MATFPILVHSGFYKILLEADSSFRGRVRKTLLRLQSGQWGQGTRVKRLAGVGQAVYEARLDRGNRLLFTAVRAADPNDPERLSTHLQIWDAVHHDKVSRRARRNLVPEAEFLDFATLEQFDIADPPPEPAADIDEASTDATEPLLHFLIPPDGFRTRMGEGISGGVRWYLAPPFMLAAETEFQRMLDAGGEELELKLMQDQYAALQMPGPLLLAGGAGSGKTTIAIHRLVEARLQMESGRILYLSYSSWLVDYARRLYGEVMRARGGNPEVDPPDFFTFPEMYRKLIPPDGPGRRANPVHPAAFAAWFRNSGVSLDAALVWEELRSILKGASLNLGHAMLDQSEYEDLGRKRAPLFVNERAQIFAIAQRYQKWLAGQERMDQIDLCRSAFRELRRGRRRKYDAIVCDEVQDLTELEVRFVLSLSADPGLGGVMLAGDMQQIVNPSGFRWAEARESIMKIAGRRKASTPVHLRRNCRSVRPLVELANTVLALRQEIFGRYEEDSAEDAVIEGPAPVQVVEAERSVLAAIRDFGPRCAILVLDEQEGTRLGRILDTTRIFHVRDAKGLEFDTVVLWKLLESESETIGRFGRRDPRTDRDVRLKQFLQHLYVAVTRARRHLAIYEGPDRHPFWNDDRFRGRLESEPAETLSRLFRQSAAPDEWIKEGDYYSERARYRQAAECYRRAGIEEKETDALAMFAESMEDWSEALELWRRNGRIEPQAGLLEKLGRLEEASSLYRELGHTEDAERLEIAVLEKHGRWAEAGKRWQAGGHAAEAARCYQRAGNTNRALAIEAEMAEAAKDWQRAAECWFKLKSYENAARCFRKCHDKPNGALAMARHHESRKAWSKASSAYRRAGDKPKADECRALAIEAEGDYSKAARLWERLGHKKRALQLYRKAGDQTAIDRFAVESADLRHPQLAKVIEFQERGRFRSAIKLAGARRAVIRTRLAKSRRVFTWKEDPVEDRMLDELYRLEAGMYECQALLAEQAQNWTKAVRYWRRARNPERTKAAQEKAIDALDDPAARGKALLRAGEYERAADAFGLAGRPEGQTEAKARLAERQEQWEEAAAYWQSIDREKDHARCMARAASSSENWTEAARWHNAAGQKTLARQAERNARVQGRAEAVRIRKNQPTLF